MYLNCHSYFSFGYGSLSVRDLVTRAKEMGCKSLTLTDINTVSGVFDFIKECQAVDIKPLVGVEFRNENDLKYIVIAKNNEGFCEINIFLSEHLRSKKPFPAKAPSFKHAFTLYPLEYFISSQSLPLEDHEFIGVHHYEINKLFKYKDYPAMRKVAAIHSLTFDGKISHNLHRILRAISENSLLSKLPKDREAHEEERFYTIDELLQKFYNCRAFLQNTAHIINECRFEFDFQTNKCKQVFTSSKKADMQLLRKLAYDGASHRYKVVTKQVTERIEKELDIIEQMSFASYFLITWDLLRHAKALGYFHVGRGSGANSIVAYCMEITDVDPIELDLYFERFINPARKSPPDFDLDFSWTDRDVLIDYLFKRYGEDHVCLLATYNTFQWNSAVREISKVFGLPKLEIDDFLRNPDKQSSNKYIQYVLKYAPLLEDIPHNLSIHAGGILITELPIFNYTALQPMPKGFCVCQWDMYVAEDICIPKLDVLSQRGLGHIKMTVDIVAQNQGIQIDIHRIDDFKKDLNVRKQLQRSETMGCFYVESPAMRQLMSKLKCDNYPVLVAASSIIRPGVASSGMMKAYIERHLNPHNIEYLHPIIGELLKETYGVMIYQEDVLKVFHEFANMTLSESDIIRRAMSGKFRSKTEFQRIVEKYFANCKELGYPDSLAKEVWRQIESFASYSFSKAHSASFAVESYQSLFLKTYFPKEFMVGVINNMGGFYRTEFYIHEARRCGANIEPPEINESILLTSIKGNTIWLGWMHIKSLELKTIEKILKERHLGGKYLSLANVVGRVDIDLKQLVILIKIGAFRQFGTPKKELLWEAHMLFYGKTKPVAYKLSLFEYSETHTFEVPKTSQEDEEIENAYDELELLDFSLISPFKLCNETITNTITVTDLSNRKVGSSVKILGYKVTVKTIRAKNNKIMSFGYFYDQEGNFFDTTHFPQILEKFPFRGDGVYEISGRVAEEFGFYSVEVTGLRKLELKPDPRSVYQGGQLEDTVILIE